MFKKKVLLVLSVISMFSSILKASDGIIPVAIIGSGCAGLSAAYVAGEYGFKPVVFAGPQKGGDLNVRTEVGNWMGIGFAFGNQIMPDVYKKATKQGAQMIHSTITQVDFSKAPFKLVDSKGKTYHAHKVIIATGTKDRIWTVPGAAQNRDKILNNWDIHKDFSDYKAKSKRAYVAIIGGGVDAMKKAFYAARAGAREVHIFVRGKRLRITPLRARFLQKMSGFIKITYGKEVSKVERLGDNKVRLYFKSGETYGANLVVTSIGRTPRVEAFKPFVKTNEKGFIVINAKTQETSTPGVYACGDVTDASGPDPQALIAVGNGMIAGYTVVEELIKEGVTLNDSVTVRDTGSKKGRRSVRKGGFWGNNKGWGNGKGFFD